MSEDTKFRWGRCPTCHMPLVKARAHTMKFKPCRNHPEAEPEVLDVCRLCKRKEVDDTSPVLAGIHVCQRCFDAHLHSVRSHIAPMPTGGK